ncbi:MAG: thiamine pyrophosphate-dependent dehydrogenase E1 component subunit alpha [marine benthic group bacterium]|nr:thiamine pyrophosphate-dependent dehydrogenase E1 component subunit alpha [Gemmatimonadota bacterium]
MASEETATGDTEQPQRARLSRRAFLGSVAASGVAFAAVSHGLKGVARADAYGQFRAADLSEEKLLWMYELMLKGRLFDLSIANRMAAGDKAVLSRLPFLHATCGQEAVGAGVAAAITRDDWLYTTHRHAVYTFARGMDPGKVLGTTMYKATGYTGGRGNHFHLSSRQHKMPNAAGLIGMEPVLAAGTAYGQMIVNQREGTDHIVVKCSGDGDYNCPDTLIALNESALFSLPIVFVVENNGYQMYVRTHETMKIKNVADRGQGFGIPGRIVDGQDPLAVYNAMKEAVARARAGDGPTIVEAKTYRYFDHFLVGGYDPRRGMGAYGLFYRSDRELQHWLAKDPVENFKRTLMNFGVLDDERATEVYANAEKEIEQAWEWVMAQPNPKSEDALKLAYADGVVTTALPRQLADCPLT